MAYDPNLMIASDVGGMIQQGIQQGQQTREQNMTKAATAALFKDPNNANALAALAQVNPEKAMAFRKQQLEYAKAKLGQHYDAVVKGGKIFREFDVKDEPTYQQARQAAAQIGIDLSEVPPNYDPQYVQGVIHLADAFAPQTETQDPSMIREFDIATKRGLVPPGTTFQQYATMRNPGMSAPVTIPYGAQVQGGTGAAPATATGPNGEKVQLNPQTGQWEPIGGQAVTPPATFP